MAASAGEELGALAAELSAIGRRAGLDAVGIASSDPFPEVERELRVRRAAGLHGGMAFTYRNPSRSTDPAQTLPGARAIVVGARAYRREEPLAAAPANGAVGRVARYSWRDEYGPLRAALRQLAERLRAGGHRAVVVADDNALVDRAAAHRAGIGWWGKNSLILIRGAGSFFVLGSVITDAALPAGDRRVADGCGSCTRCLEACPTSAIVSPGVLDARRCLAWLLEAPGSFPVELRTALGNRIYGCDDCQDVCPVNRSALRHRPPPPSAAGDEAHVDLLEMLASSDDRLIERFGRFYFAGRDPAVLRRNALVALANEADPSDRRVREAVAAASGSGSDLIAEHARWAGGRLDERRRERERSRVTHLLVTNDYPPKLGGIQTYLRELWRRQPPDGFVVLTAARAGSTAFDSGEPYPIERVGAGTLVPTPGLVHRVRRLAERTDAGLVMIDPAFPLGLIGPRLGVPYGGVVLHGAEVTVPARLPGTRRLLCQVLAHASLAVAAGPYPEAEARRIAAGSMPPTVNVPPGVDTYRFRPLSPDERLAARRRFGLGEEGPLLVSVSRLVPRKGMDVLIEAAARLATTRPRLTVAIAGIGRDEARLRRLARSRGGPVHFLGAVPNEDLPALYGAADVAVMLCRDRWLGLERAGFGIIFLEAAAAGVPQVAGDSGGAVDAVVEGTTGLVVHRPADPRAAASAIAVLLDDEPLRRRLGAASRARAVAELDVDVLARRLGAALEEAGG